MTPLNSGSATGGGTRKFETLVSQSQGQAQAQDPGAATLQGASLYHQSDRSQQQLSRPLEAYQVASAASEKESWQDTPLHTTFLYLKDSQKRSLDILQRIEAQTSRIYSHFGQYLAYQNNSGQVYPKKNDIMLLDLLQKWSSDEAMKECYPYTWGGFIELLEDIGHSNLAAEVTEVVREKAALGLLKKTSSHSVSEMATAMGSLSMKEKASSDELDEDDLDEILKELNEVKGVYFSVGTSLGLRYSTVDNIRKKKLDCAEALAEVLISFLKKEGSKKKGTQDLKKPTTWKTIVEAVASSVGGNNNALAIKLAEKYGVTDWS